MPVDDRGEDEEEDDSSTAMADWPDGSPARSVMVVVVVAVVVVCVCVSVCECVRVLNKRNRSAHTSGPFCLLS